MKRKDILEKMKNQTNLINTLHNEGKIDEAFKAVEVYDNLEKELKIVDRIEANSNESTLKDFVKVDGVNKPTFYDTIKNPAKFVNAMGGHQSEGMLLPETDVKTVKDLRREFGSLEDIITVVPTNTRKGSFIVESINDTEGLQEVTELGSINEVTNLAFKQVKWDIKDYAGLLKISRTLLSDSVENLQKRITNSLAKKGAISIRQEILKVLNTFKCVKVADLDGIKEIINVKLDMSLLEGSIIVMGQETYHHIDTLKDSNGNYIFQNDINNPSGKVLFGLPVKVVNHKVLKKGIMYIGNVKEGVHEYVMQGINVEQSEHAFFSQNVMAFKAIERFDIVKADDDAVFKVCVCDLCSEDCAEECEPCEVIGVPLKQTKTSKR